MRLMWVGQFYFGLKFCVDNIVDYVLEEWVHSYLVVVDQN
jgi:hypothetical protein